MLRISKEIKKKGIICEYWLKDDTPWHENIDKTDLIANHVVVNNLFIFSRTIFRNRFPIKKLLNFFKYKKVFTELFSKYDVLCVSEDSSIIYSMILGCTKHQKRVLLQESVYLKWYDVFGVQKDFINSKRIYYLLVLKKILLLIFSKFFMIRHFSNHIYGKSKFDVFFIYSNYFFNVFNYSKNKKIIIGRLHYPNIKIDNKLPLADNRPIVAVFNTNFYPHGNLSIRNNFYLGMRELICIMETCQIKFSDKIYLILKIKPDDLLYRYYKQLAFKYNFILVNNYSALDIHNISNISICSDFTMAGFESLLVDKMPIYTCITYPYSRKKALSKLLDDQFIIIYNKKELINTINEYCFENTINNKNLFSLKAKYFGPDIEAEKQAEIFIRNVV
jgi:hypothetical protein